MRFGRDKEECVVVATSAAMHHVRDFFPTNRIHKYITYCMYSTSNLGRPHALARAAPL
jgi:hypothetical protein